MSRNRWEGTVQEGSASKLWRERALWFGVGAVVWIAAVFGMLSIADEGSGRIALFGAFLLAVPSLLAFWCGYYWRGAIPETRLVIEVQTEGRVTVTHQPLTANEP